MPRHSYQSLPIGVDFDGDGVRLVQLEVSRSADAVTACRVKTAASEAVIGESATALSAAVKQALATHRFSGVDVVACLPRDMVHVRSVRVPGVVDATLDGRILDAAAPLFSFANGEARLQIVSAGPVRDGDKATCEAVVLAVRHDDIDAFLLPLQDAGLRVAALDAPLISLFRGIDRFTGDWAADDTRFIVELGRRQSRVVIATGRDIRFYKTIDNGIAQLAKAVSRKLGIAVADADALRRRLIDRPTDGSVQDPVRQAVFDATRGVAEQFARELVLCQRYYSVMFRGRPPQRLELTGASANDPSLHRIFSSMLGLETISLRPPIDVAGANPDLSDGSWAAAFGAALKFAPDMPIAAPTSESPVVGVDETVVEPELAHA